MIILVYLRRNLKIFHPEAFDIMKSNENNPAKYQGIFW